MSLSLFAKLARYAAVGLLTLAIYLSVAKAAGRLGMTLSWQASMAFISAVVVNYLLQRSWVFADCRPAASSLPKYVLMVSVGYMVNLAALEALTPRIPVTVAMLVAVVVVVISNAVLSFTWVFLDRDARTSRPALRKDGDTGRRPAI
jgi:putative flippase GtrA